MYPTPKILNYSQTFGFTLGCFISIQILSGICLSSFFCDLSNINSKFFFINIFDNTEYGFFIQKLHSVGVYAIFCLLTIHFNFCINNSYRIYRVCSTLRADVLLRCCSYYQFFICDTLHWYLVSNFYLRRYCYF